MKNLHRFVIAAGVAGLGFLGLSGTQAFASNAYRSHAPMNTRVVVGKAARSFETVREQVREANRRDPGCRN